MSSHLTPRGTTLIESMVAMAVLLIGAAGMASLHTAGVRTEADSRRITRATALAQDLESQVNLWAYNDPRLTNDVPGNDAVFGDRGMPAIFTSPTYFNGADPVANGHADHGEVDLVKGGRPWFGLPAAAVDGYERYWNVAYPDDTNGNGVPDGVRIAVVVRWPAGANWHRVVILMTKPNPVEAP